MTKRSTSTRGHDFSATPAARDARAQKQLGIVFSELQELLSDTLGSGYALPVILASGDDPHIAIHNASTDISARVTIDAENGLYVFCELDSKAGILMVTANEERLIDTIIAHLSAGNDSLSLQTIDSAIGVIVGLTIQDVERKLILQSLRHCSGNLTYAAFMLGIPPVTLSNKLTTYFPGSAKDFSLAATGGSDPAETDRK